MKCQTGLNKSGRSDERQLEKRRTSVFFNTPLGIRSLLAPKQGIRQQRHGFMRVKNLILTAISLYSIAHAQTEDIRPNAAISRKDLVTETISPSHSYSRIKTQEISIDPGIGAPLHLHPCPTFGVISQGEISFQIEGHPPQLLKVGDAFFEPADTRIAKFNNEGTVPAKFVVFYLLDEESQETIRLLAK
ncbi:MAG TPA: cupin domain-containing protein [Aquabacterium sp.]|nr:cupin domain-containing protein [Aquabacterium sp.]